MTVNITALMKNSKKLSECTEKFTESLEQDGAGSFLKVENLMNMQLMMSLSGVGQSSALGKLIPKLMFGSMISQALVGKPLDGAAQLIGTKEGEDLLKQRYNKLADMVGGLIGAGTGAGANLLDFASNKLADGLNLLNKGQPSPFMDQLSSTLQGFVGEDGSAKAKGVLKQFFEGLKFQMEQTQEVQNAQANPKLQQKELNKIKEALQEQLGLQNTAKEITTMVGKLSPDALSAVAGKFGITVEELCSTTPATGDPGNSKNAPDNSISTNNFITPN